MGHKCKEGCEHVHEEERNFSSYLAFCMLSTSDDGFELSMIEDPYLSIVVHENTKEFAGTSLFLEITLDQTDIEYTPSMRDEIEGVMIQKYSQLKDRYRNSSIHAGILADMEKELNYRLTQHLGLMEKVERIEGLAKTSHAMFVNALKGKHDA